MQRAVLLACTWWVSEQAEAPKSTFLAQKLALIASSLSLLLPSLPRSLEKRLPYLKPHQRPETFLHSAQAPASSEGASQGKSYPFHELHAFYFYWLGDEGGLTPLCKFVEARNALPGACSEKDQKDTDLRSSRCRCWESLCLLQNPRRTVFRGSWLELRLVRVSQEQAPGARGRAPAPTGDMGLLSASHTSHRPSKMPAPCKKRNTSSSKLITMTADCIKPNYPFLQICNLNKKPCPLLGLAQ